MQDCCTVETRGEAGAPPNCPECGRAGRIVERITVKAILRPEALARLGASAHRFCATPACAVVYFGHDETFDRRDTAVPVFQKEPAGQRTVCYCFGVTEADLRREIAQTGGSTAGENITAHVKAGRCACEVKNPQGSCCLGNVASAVREARAVVSGNRQADLSNAARRAAADQNHAPGERPIEAAGR